MRFMTFWLRDFAELYLKQQIPHPKQELKMIHLLYILIGVTFKYEVHFQVWSYM